MFGMTGQYAVYATMYMYVENLVRLGMGLSTDVGRLSKQMGSTTGTLPPTTQNQQNLKKKHVKPISSITTSTQLQDEETNFGWEILGTCT